MRFTKMHGLGNDFIVLKSDTKKQVDYFGLAKDLCDRHQGIGADGILLAEPSKVADVKMRVINADGSEAEMCGNGIRCFAKYVYVNGIVKKEKLTVETLAGIIEPKLVIKDDHIEGVKVNMGRPKLNRSDIPMLGVDGTVLNEKIEANGGEYHITSLLMGVPHTMLYVKDINSAPVTSLGPIIEKHPLFPRKTNVNFVEVVNGSEIKVRTWERGAGATLACGTGSCASVVASYLLGKTKRNVMVHLALGSMDIEYCDDETVYMTGPAAFVFEGEIEV
jgi:diaminopimelate epimerase